MFPYFSLLFPSILYAHTIIFSSLKGLSCHGLSSDAEAYDRMTVEERQQLWNETEGTRCICGTWSMYDTHDGGWAPTAAVDGMLGCHNTSVSGSDFCLYCTGEPEQPCDKWG